MATGRHEIRRNVGRPRPSQALGMSERSSNLLDPLGDQGKVSEAGEIQEGCLEEVVFGEFGHQEE